GRRRAEQNDVEAAWHDLLQAELLGRAEGDAGKLRQDLTRAGLNEVRVYLRAGQPRRAAEGVSRPRERGGRMPQQNLLEDAAKNWMKAGEQAGEGDFAQAIDTLEGVRRLLQEPTTPLEQFRQELSQRRRLFSTLLPRLHAAADARKWREALDTA